MDTDKTRDELGEKFGPDNVWDTKELQEVYEVRQFAAPLVLVKRKSDNVLGSLFFQHWPRFYFQFEPENSVEN